MALLSMTSWYMRDTATGMSSTMSTVKRLKKQVWSSSGTSPDGRLVEIVELPGHPWFLAVQFHPNLHPVRTVHSHCSVNS